MEYRYRLDYLLDLILLTAGSYGDFLWFSFTSRRFFPPNQSGESSHLRFTVKVFIVQNSGFTVQTERLKFEQKHLFERYIYCHSEPKLNV